MIDKSAPDIRHSRMIRRLRRNRYAVRFIGWSFVVGGGVLFFSFYSAYVDPNATILVNEVPTNDPDVKRQAMIFVSFFIIIGATFVLLPRRMIDRLFIAMESLKASVFGRPI